MSFDLTAIAVREPALWIRDPNGSPSYFWSANPFELKPVVEYFPIPAGVHATPEERIKNLYWEISTTLVGEFEYLNYLYPLLGPSLGASVLGRTDVAWRLITPSGKQWDFPRGGLTKRPVLSSRVGGTLLGPCTFAAVCASDKEPGDAGAFYTFTDAGTFPNFASFDPAKILTLAPAINYGALMVDAHTENGVEFEFGWQTKPVLDNSLVRDWTVESQEFTAKLKPWQITTEQIATACGYNQAMGSRLPTATLVASYTGFYAALRGAQCKEASFKFHASEDVVQGLTFRATQTYAANAQVAPGYVGVTAPA